MSEPDTRTYPEYADREEQRRAWVVALFCATAEGPLFDSLPQHAAAVVAFLKDGTVAEKAPAKPRRSLAAVS